MTIKILSKQLASQIAAGEVVERPASVVKELLENAVDAQGSEILCEVRGAGKTLIRVRDNGSGIPKAELPLALYPHATSKISSLEDLEAVGTLGFRGEALASIASVSKFTLTSKPKAQEHAFAVRVEGSELNPSVSPAAHPDGTTAEACELFFNTPARRRFLKSDRTEMLRIKDVFVRCALAHPAIGFELIADGKSLLKVKPAVEPLEIDLARCLKLTGCDFSHGAVKISRRDKAVAIEGFMFVPLSEEQAVLEQIFLFLNGRPIADRMVIHALKEGFCEVIGKNLPLRCVIYLSCNQGEVDVNVHPRKDEVRFHQSLLVHDVIAGAVADALRAFVASKEQVQSGLFVNDLGFKAKLDPKITEQESMLLSQPKQQELDAFPSGFGAFYKLPDSQKHSDILGGEPSSLGAVEQNALENDTGLNSGFNKGVNLSAQTAALVLSADCGCDKNEATTQENGMTLVDVPIPGIAFVRFAHRYFLVRIKQLELQLEALSYRQSIKDNCVILHHLSLPFAIKAPQVLLKALKPALAQALRCGFELTLTKTAVELTAVPALLKGSNLAAIPNTVLSLIAASQTSLLEGNCPRQLAWAVASCKKEIPLTFKETINLISRVPNLEFLLDLKQDCFEVKLQSWAEEFLGNE